MPRFEARRGEFLEVELNGATLAYCKGSRHHIGKITSRDYAGEDEARWAMSRLVGRHLRDDFVWAGPSQIVPPAPPSGLGPDDDAPALPASPSSLMLDEYFEAGNELFLGEVLASASSAR